MFNPILDLFCRQQSMLNPICGIFPECHPILATILESIADPKASSIGKVGGAGEEYG